MAEKRIGIIVDAKDNASKKFQTMSKSMGASLKTVSTAAAVAGGAMSALLAITVKDGAAAESANKQLEHAVLNVTGATEEQLKATMALADELERTGVLAATNIKVGQAQLSTFGLTNREVQGLSKSMADYAVSQFGVNASQEQMTQSANVFAKVLQGQFGVLEKSGIRFTEAQKQAILFGDEMERLTAINEGMAQNLKFTNDVALQTFEGQLAKLKVQVGNVSEEIGLALIPALVDIANKVRPVVENILSWMRENPRLMQTIVQVTAVVASLATVIGGLGLIIGPLTAGITALGAALGVLLSPVGAIVIAVAGLTAGILHLWETNEGFREFVIEAWENIKTSVVSAMQVVGDAVTNTLSTISTAWQNDWGGMRTTAEGLIIWFTDEFLPLFEEVTNLFLGYMEGLRIGIEENWQLISGIFSTALQAIQTNITVAFTAMKGFIMTTWQVMSGFLKTGLAILRGDWSAAWEAIKGTIIGVWTSIQTTVTTIASEIWGFVTDQFDKIGIDVGGALNSLLETMKTVWSRIVQTVKNAINELLGPIGHFIDLVGNAARGAANFASQAGAGLSSAVTGFRAVGGPVSSGSPYVVGEKGSELFVPDQRGTIIPNHQMGGGANIVINVTGNTLLSDDAGEEIGNMIFNNLRLQTRT